MINKLDSLMEERRNRILYAVAGNIAEIVERLDKVRPCVDSMESNRIHGCAN